MTAADYITRPPLPDPGHLLVDDLHFEYPSRVAAGRGRAHLRLWQAAGTDDPRLLAVVTEIEDGSTVTNAAAEILALLTARHGDDLVLLEHYNEASRSGDPNLSVVTVTDGTPAWSAVWPTSPSHPRHAEHTAWMRRNASLLPPGAAA